jgi:uncharacterized protein YndB with AHSA1/START domain
MADQSIVITRVLDAPRERAFKAFTDPEHFARWWGPNGFTTPACRMDVRAGGVLHYCMRSPKGHDFWGKGVYREIVEPERIVYADTFADPEGNPVEPARYGLSPGWPSETLVTVTFAAHEGKTTLTLEHTVGTAPESERDMCQQGWGESLDRLAGFLATAPTRTGGEALARQFEAKVRETVAVLERLSDADWTKVAEGEGWTVGATAHHLADAFEAVGGIASAIASGGSPGHFTTAMLDEMNAHRAREHGNCPRAETIALLRAAAAATGTVVRDLTDDQLARSGAVFADLPPMTVERLIVRGLIIHIDEHAGSIRKAIGA